MKYGFFTNVNILTLLANLIRQSSEEVFEDKHVRLWPYQAAAVTQWSPWLLKGELPFTTKRKLLRPNRENYTRNWKYLEMSQWTFFFSVSQCSKVERRKLMWRFPGSIKFTYKWWMAKWKCHLILMFNN